jgi:hypothetical protein
MFGYIVDRRMTRLRPVLAILGSLMLAPAANAYDVRHTQPLTSALAPVTSAVSQLQKTLGLEGVVSIDPLTGTPRVIAKTDGFLTGPQTGTPRQIVRRYVLSHRSVLRLGAGDLQHLRLLRNMRAPDGSTTLIWAQAYKGIPSLDTTLRATVDRYGRLVQVGGSPLPDLKAPTTPVLSAVDALQTALDSVKSKLPLPAIVQQATGARLDTLFAGGNEARLILFNTGGAVRLGWQVWAKTAPDQVWDTIVDASSGRILRRVNRVLHAGMVKAWDFYPGAPKGGSADTRDLSKYFTAPDRLEGNYAHVFLDTPNDDTPDPEDEVRPDGNGNYVKDFEPVLSPLGNCPAAGCSWDHIIPNSWETNLDQNAQQVFYFVNHYADHLKAAPIGFDEASGNFQTKNQSGKGKGKDALLAQASDGAATAIVIPDPFNNATNANMLTPADGTPPQMQMYLFEPLPALAPDFADVNGGDDASIVYHEFTHGLTNRLVILGDGDGALTSPQAGAMGEAWSDFYAEDYLISQGFETDSDAPGEIIVGGFTDNFNNSLRTEAIDCTIGADDTACPRVGADEVPQTGGYAYDAFGKIIGQPEPHADGEIWSQTLMEIRRALIAAHGTDDGEQRTLALVTGGLRLSPPEPSFLDMRNSILEADTMAGGADHDLLWKIFARRGMGFDARSTDGFDEEPTAGFAVPPAAGGPTGTVSGTLTDADSGKPLVGIPGGITSFFSGIANDIVGFSGSDGVFKIPAVPVGGYGPVRVGGLGYEPQTLGDATVAKGKDSGGFDAKLKRNYAMLEGGTRIITREGLDQGCGPALALDANPMTGYEVPSENSKFGGGDKHLVLELPGPIDISQLVLDPTNNCGSDETSSLGGYTLETSKDGKTYRTASEGTFTPADRHPNTLDVPAAAKSGVRYVKLTIKTAQGLPANPLGTTYNDYIDITDLSIFGKSADTQAPTLKVRGFKKAARGPQARLRGTVKDDFRVANLTVNGAVVSFGSNGKFSVPVAIAKGRNRFVVQALDGSQNATSKALKVRGDFRKPRLRKVRATLLSTGRVLVRGRALDDSGIRVVRVNGRKASVVKRRFSATVKLRRRIKVVAVDLVGRRTSKRVVPG